MNTCLLLICTNKKAVNHYTYSRPIFRGKMQWTDFFSSRLQNLPQGILITNPADVRYLSGFSGSFGWVVWESAGPCLITDDRYLSAVKSTLPTTWKVIDRETQQERWKKASKNTLWWIQDSLTIAQQRRLKKTAPQIHWSPVAELCTAARRNKNTAEKAKILTAAEQTDRVFTQVLPTLLHAGVTERAVAWQLELALRDQGDFELSFPPIVAFGSNSAIPHHQPSDQKLRAKDPVLVDAGAAYQGYHSDLTRCALFGGENPAFRQLYEAVLATQQSTIARAKAGKKVKALDTFCRQQLGDSSEQFTHSLGHGVGLEIHEAPHLSVHSAEALRAGDFITIEPGVYQDGQWGVRIEDLLEVTVDGVDYCSHTPRDLVVYR